jgi:hypothetical protein
VRSVGVTNARVRSSPASHRRPAIRSPAVLPARGGRAPLSGTSPFASLRLCVFGWVGASAPLRSKWRVGGLGDDLRVFVPSWLRRGRAAGLCALSVFSVSLWFDRLLESIGVNDPVWPCHGRAPGPLPLPLPRTRPSDIDTVTETVTETDTETASVICHWHWTPILAPVAVIRTRTRTRVAPTSVSRAITDEPNVLTWIISTCQRGWEGGGEFRNPKSEIRNPKSEARVGVPWSPLHAR